MAKNDYIIHAVALGEVYLERYKSKIEHLSHLTIRKVKKNGEHEDIVIEKGDLSIALRQIFENGVTGLTDIRICKVELGVTEELTSITIY